eukprot:TRINITY_DN1431_c1_g1_i3.p1 TRINITY_DN1431_c1_g1~~TRINITY_DN1431_c1_g1_i3.p1  ORF type:complete len:262 (+),score=37.66 TRINITY_DN1431_c1_g1_i3:800-1585(+)
MKPLANYIFSWLNFENVHLVDAVRVAYRLIAIYESQSLQKICWLAFIKRYVEQNSNVIEGVTLTEEEFSVVLHFIGVLFYNAKQSVESLHSILKSNLQRDVPVEFASYLYEKASKGVTMSAFCGKGWRREGFGELCKSAFMSSKRRVRFVVDEPPLYYQHNCSYLHCKLFETGFWGRETLYKTIELDSECTVKYYTQFHRVSWENKKTNTSDTVDIDFESVEGESDFKSAVGVNVHLSLFMECLQHIHTRMHHYLDVDWSV